MNSDKKPYVYNCVMMYALHDIAQWMKNDSVRVRDKNRDIWTVTASQLVNSKEIRRMNRLLGIDRINHFGNTNGKHKKK